MTGLWYTAHVVGWRRLLELFRGYRLGWQGTLAGYFTTRSLQALLNVGFFDALEIQGSVDTAVFAASRNLDPQILQSLCDSLYAQRILRRAGAKNDTSYSLDAKGRVLTQVARGWFDGVYGYEEVWHSLEALLTKRSAYGTDIGRKGDHIARGSGEMENWIYFPLAIDAIRKAGYRTVLDLGCGDALFLAALCQEQEDVVGYGIDLSPAAIAAGQERVMRAGLETRIHLSVGDITKLDLPRDHLPAVDVATTFFILHEILFRGAECVVALLRSFRVAFPGVPLIVFEVTRPTPEERRKRPGMSVHYILQHDLTQQKVVPAKEWRDLFRAAGFSSVEERTLGFARTAMYTLR